MSTGKLDRSVTMLKQGVRLWSTYRDFNVLNQVFPNSRGAHKIGPGIEIRDDPIERRRRDGQLDDLTSLE